MDASSASIDSRKTPTKVASSHNNNNNGHKSSPSQADEATRRPSPARPTPLSVQNLINSSNKNDKNINNNSTVNNFNHSNNYVKRESNKSTDIDDDAAASPNRKVNSMRTKDTATSTAKNGMDFNHKRSFPMDMSNEIKSNNQSDADIKVRHFFRVSYYYYGFVTTTTMKIEIFGVFV
jgi:hypothetical protein